MTNDITPREVGSHAELDLVERLRRGWPYRGADARLLCEEAAAEIERLRDSAGGTLPATHTAFALGDEVRKVSGSDWSGRVCGNYSTNLTPEGYAVESGAHPGSVQIYPAAALTLVRRVRDAAVAAEHERCAKP